MKLYLQQEGFLASHLRVLRGGEEVGTLQKSWRRGEATLVLLGQAYRIRRDGPRGGQVLVADETVLARARPSSAYGANALLECAEGCLRLERVEFTRLAVQVRAGETYFGTIRKRSRLRMRLEVDLSEELALTTRVFAAWIVHRMAVERPERRAADADPLLAARAG